MMSVYIVVLLHGRGKGQSALFAPEKAFSVKLPMMWKGVVLMDAMAVLSRGKALEGNLRSLRRRLHSCPEIGFDLKETASVVEERLSSLGIPWRRVARTGIAAFLEGEAPGMTVALRADTDALPVSEEADVPWRSAAEGRMHACGHDVHAACLLGAAEILASCRGDLRGNVSFLFQPAEETSGGALPMIREGVLDGAAGAFALHCSPDIPAGSVGVHFGKFRAASDMFDCAVTGKGTHGAEPHRGTDVIAISAQVICALHQLTGRTVSPTEPAVLSIGAFHAGTARNVLPERAEFSGIIRTLSQESRKGLKEKVERTVKGFPAIHGAAGEVTFTEGYPLLVNDPSLSELVFRAAGEIFGKESAVELKEPSMGVDDFAFMLERVPGCYFLLGTGHGDGREEAPLHSPRFDPDERCLGMGAVLLAWTALSFLAGSYQK